MIVYGDPETWGMKVDQFLDSRRLERESFADGTNPKIKMILDMLRRGMDVDTISTITGATVEEINNIAKTAKPISTEELSPEEPLSKNKTYSEIDILSNIDAKNPGGITGEDVVINPMPNPVPRMDEYMPEAEEIEDPRYRQLELADGGVVQREEFAKGSEPVFASEKKIESFKKEMKKKYPGLGVSEGLTSGGKRQIRIRYAKRFGSERKPAFERNRYLIPTKKNLQILREDAASFVKEAKEKGFEIISDPYELRAKQGLEKTKDQQKLFNDILEKVKQGKNFKYNTLAEKEIYRKLSTNIYKHNSEVGRNLGKGVPFLRNILEEDVDKVLNKINNLPGLRDLNRGDIQYLIRQSYPAGSKQRLEAFKNFKNYERVATEVRNKFGLQFQLEHPLSRKAIERAGAGGIKESLLRVKAVPKVFNDFKNKYDTRLNEIQRNLLDPTLRPQASEQLKSLNQIGKLMFEGYDVGELTSTGKVKRYGSDPFIKTDLVEGLKQSLSLNNQVKQNVIKYKPQLTPLFESAGLSPKILARGEKLVPIAKQTQILNFIEKLNPTEKKVISKFGNKVSMGLDPTDVLKMLPEKEYQIMKGAMSKVGNLTTMGVRGAQELLVGTGPVGLGITAALTVPFMVADLAEGKRFSEALQNQASALTFGFIPEADKRIIEEIGGSEAGVGFEIQQNIDKLKILQNDLREAEKRTSDDIMDPEAELAQSNFVENTRKSINKTFQDLLPYLNEQGQIIAPEYNAYLQASNKAEQERAYRKGIGDLQAYNVGFDDISISEEGPFQQDIDKLLKGKKQLEKSYSKILSADDLINQYAYGGRVNFEKGGDPKDKPILPINPMIGGEDPRGSLQDPGRRDVLKGMGLLGAGVAAGKLGLLKLGKAIKKAPLTSIVKPMGKTMTQFPTWFPTLVNRIRKEGTQIPIFKTKDVNISKQEYDALKQQGTKNLFDQYIGRTENYVNELKQQGIPRYYQKVNTDEIIGYKYEVKDLPNVKVTDLAGKEIRIDFPNAYGKDVTMTYKAPKVSVDMQGKKVKYDAEFQVDDAVPESGGYPGDVPDFYGEIVNNLDEVYGGASQIEQYALKLKKPRTTQGDEVVNAWDAGQPHMSVKEIRELELKKQKKQGRRDYAKQQVDEKPATFEDREFLKNFLDAGDDID
jgi:hypothetical protein